MKHLVTGVIGAAAIFAGTSAFANNFGTNNSTCNYQTIQQAIAATGPNGTIFAKGGTRNITQEIVLPHSLTI